MTFILAILTLYVIVFWIVFPAMFSDQFTSYKELVIDSHLFGVIISVVIGCFIAMVWAIGVIQGSL